MKKEIELPELTQEQADFIEQVKEKGYVTGIESIMEKWMKFNWRDFKIETKGFEGFEPFYVAYIFGYTIKKEPKYYIHIIKNSKFGYINLIGENFNGVQLMTKNPTSNFRTQFTEDEIKSKFPNLWEFRELVEE